MRWTVLFHDEFVPEAEALPRPVRVELAATVDLLLTEGPMLGRPHADTLKGSNYVNMKELRFSANGGVWRVAFAFDPKRRALLLVAGDKAGVGQDRFYKSLIAKADSRYASHLHRLKG